MGGFSRYGMVDTLTIGLVFLLILPCERNALFRSPVLHHAGTYRLQIVGVGSLHVLLLVTEQQTA